jgi:hypothetical protein
MCNSSSNKKCTWYRPHKWVRDDSYYEYPACVFEWYDICSRCGKRVYRHVFATD